MRCRRAQTYPEPALPVEALVNVSTVDSPPGLEEQQLLGSYGGGRQRAGAEYQSNCQGHRRNACAQLQYTNSTLVRHVRKVLLRSKFAASHGMHLVPCLLAAVGFHRLAWLQALRHYPLLLTTAQHAPQL